MKKVYLLLLLLNILVFIQCATMFPVVTVNELSEIILMRTKLIDYQINVKYSSDLPDDYKIKFDPLFGKQSYNINEQVKQMYNDYFQFKSNISSKKQMIINIHINNFETEYEEVRGDIKRTAIVELNLEIMVDEKSLINQKVIGKESILALSGPRYGSWMAVYSAAINKAINKSIIMTDNLIDNALNQ